MNPARARTSPPLHRIFSCRPRPRPIPRGPSRFPPCRRFHRPPWRPPPARPPPRPPGRPGDEPREASAWPPPMEAPPAPAPSDSKELRVWVASTLSRPVPRRDKDEAAIFVGWDEENPREPPSGGARPRAARPEPGDGAAATTAEWRSGRRGGCRRGRGRLARTRRGMGLPAPPRRSIAPRPTRGLLRPPKGRRWPGRRAARPPGPRSSPPTLCDWGPRIEGMLHSRWARPADGSGLSHGEKQKFAPRPRRSIPRAPRRRPEGVR